MYCEEAKLSPTRLNAIITALQPQIVYMNSMYSLRFTLIPLFVLIRLRSRARIVLAPRGMLQQGAMVRKTGKKKLFLQLFKLLGWNKRVHFHATDAQEAADILHYFPKGTRVQIAANIPNRSNQRGRSQSKAPNRLNAVYISRIHPKKNLHFLLGLLPRLDASIVWQFDIYGEEDDAGYAARCKSMSEGLPAHQRVNFHGPIRNNQVSGILLNSNLFVLPTLGENFGHSIFEALDAGCPVLISDRTPWQKLEQMQAGWALPLDQPQKYVEVLHQVARMDDGAWRTWSEGAYQLSRQYLSSNDYHQQYRSLFN